MNWATLASSVIGDGTAGLLSTTTGIPAVLTALVPVIVLTAGIKWFFKLKRKVGV